MHAVSEDELKAHSKAPRVTEEELLANIVHESYINAAVGAAASNHAVYGLKPNKGTVKVLFDLEQQQGELPISLGLLTICVLVLKNGFTVVGESACASVENFDPEIGKRLAYQDAKKKIWALMGYELRSKLMTRAGGLVGEEHF